MKEGEFIDQYLYIDSDGDYVLKSKPCPFLGDDNFAVFMKQGLRIVQDFPYTDEDVILKRQAITLKNATFCPITYFVLEKLMQQSKRLIPGWLH